MIKADIYKPDVLNIFCDASTRKKGDGFDVCYGAIAVVQDTIIDKVYRINSNSTNNNAEIKAIRAGILLAIRYKNRFSQINLFSDSQISLFGIRDRISTWKLDNRTNELYGYSDRIASQEVFIEILNLIVDRDIKLRMFHQKGHVNLSNFKSIYNACHVFAASNNIREKIDYNIIRYISGYNNIVDEESRHILNTTDIYKTMIIEPVRFIPLNFYGQINSYNKIMKRRL